MDKKTDLLVGGHAFELQFHPIAQQGRELRFPCDARGQVNLDDLSDHSRREYLFAHMLIGRDFASPVVHASDR